VQSAVNKCATAALGCSKFLIDWGQDGVEEDAKLTFFARITNDLEIVRVVLLLTGSMQGTRMSIIDYLSTFEKFNFLWLGDGDAAYKEFMKKAPTIDEYDAELQRFGSIDDDVGKVSMLHNIGALSINSTPVKNYLRSLNAQWKVQYSDNLHRTAQSLLSSLSGYFRAMLTKLNREPDSLDSIKYLMDVLNEVRDKEASIDMAINPVLEMYTLLDTVLPE